MMYDSGQYGLEKYPPKKVDFDLFFEQKLLAIQYHINERPRKKLNYDSQKNAFFDAIQ